jgi:tRNA A-37 threonylcarbamoyl transferase component Bud32
MAKLGNIFFNRTLNQFLECEHPGGKKGLSLVEKLRESTDSNLDKVLETIAQVDDPHREALKQLCFESVDGFSEDQFLNGASKNKSTNSASATPAKAIDASKLYQRLHEPGAAVGDVIELLDAKKQFLRPEEIINNSLKLDSEYAMMLLPLVYGSEIPVNLSNLSFKLDKFDSAEFRIKLLHYFGSINETKVPLIVARFLDDSNKVVILEALKTLGRMQFDYDVSVLLPYTQTMSGIEYEQVMDIVKKRAGPDLVPHLSAYLSCESDELNDFFAETVAIKSDKKNFEKFLRRLMLEDPATQKKAIDLVKKFANNGLSRIAHELNGHDQEFVRSAAQCLVVNLIEGEDLDKIEKFALNENPQLRERAIKSLGKSANRGAISILQKLVDAWPEDTVLALRTVKHLGFEHGLEIAFDALRSPDANLKRAALETMEALASESCAQDICDNIDRSLASIPAEFMKYANELIARLTSEFRLADKLISEEDASVDLRVDADPSASTTGSISHTSPLDLLIPGSVWMDRYHIQKEIGRGAMGRVMLVEDDMVDEAMIIKFMLPALTIEKKSTERFKREVKYARRISHRNVIRVHDLLIKDNVCAISMEYFESRGLDMILKDKKLIALREGLKLLYQTASGMVAAHEQEVIHRDLKPSNVLINSEGHLKIVDFGIASAGTTSESTLTQTGSIIGSPAYLAPERAIGAVADERCDIYSLGVMAYYVLSGKLPYVGSPMDVVMQHRKGDAVPIAEVNPAISKDVATLVTDMMAVEPEDRLQTMVDVRDRIRKLLGQDD